MRFAEYLQEAKLELKSGGNKAALDAFMDEFRQNTYPNPFDPSMRVHNDSVGLSVRPWNGHIHLSFIVSFDKKESGNASKSLKWITELADKHDVKMDLEVAPVKTAGSKDGKSLTKTQLKSWYKRFGFKSVGADNMLRIPNEV